MVCGGFICSRNTLIFLNVLYFCVGVMLVCLAAYAKALAIITTIPSISGIIACGAFLLMSAIVGLVGSVKHHQVLLFFYMVILFLIFLLQFSVACASLALTDGQQKDFFNLGWKLASPSLKNKTQIMLDCCGMDKYSQINNVSQPEYNHPTCYSNDCNATGLIQMCCHGNENNLNSTGNKICPVKDCWEVIEPQLHQLVRAVGAIGLFFSFSELLAVWLTIRYRNLKSPDFNPSIFL